MVVLVTGFSFLGYVANRIFGERNGTIATAVIGGLYSSTAVTQALAQRLGSAKRAGAEPAGIALASTVMYLRVPFLVAILATRALDEFVILLAPAFIVSAIASWILYRRAPKSGDSAAPGNPIAILPALGFLAFVAIAAVAARWAQGRFGEEGIAVLLLIVGSTDVDTAIITLGGLDPTAIGAPLAALALAGTVLANMAVKLGITLAYARGKGLSAALALGASMVALVVAIVVGVDAIVSERRHQNFRPALRRSNSGDPNGTRTRVFAVKGRRPRPLDDGAAWKAARRLGERPQRVKQARHPPDAFRPHCRRSSRRA